MSSKKNSGKKPQTPNKPQNAQTKAPVKAAAKAPAAPAQTGAVDYREVGRIAAILTAICLIITLLLAGTNMLTEKKIAENSLKEKQEACALVFPGAEDYVLFENEAFPDADVYLAVNGGEVAGAVVTTVDKGYGGELSVMTGLDMAGNITGVKLLEHSETPGLGANAANEDWLRQFVTDWENGMSRPEKFDVTKDGGTIDAVTAATRSSRAVTRAVNSAIELFDEMKAADALVLPADYVYVPSQTAQDALPVSGADASNTDAQPVVNEDGTVPTIVAGGEQ